MAVKPLMIRKIFPNESSATRLKNFATLRSGNTSWSNFDF
jgi:hypothetical protein